MSVRYARSEELLARARKTIPLGAQTFSKSVTQYPLGVSPYFAERAKGSRLWDADGNEYIDFINALASVTLGYCDPDVDGAVRAQLEKGTIYSLSHVLEAEVAEMICELVPSAEMVRFGKNGSDATSGAIRIARAFTGRDHVLSLGYHGWQDWYVGATLRNKGVPASTSALTHALPYNDLPALEAKLAELDGKVAAIIMEPMTFGTTKPGYLEGVRAAATKTGAILVFDETITGFRVAMGGAQEHFGVTPDLTTLGKGVANGYPLSVVCGRRDVMMEMEEVFFSFTMGGETLSLAAALATMKKLKTQPILKSIATVGERMSAGIRERIERHKVGGFISFSGHPAWNYLAIGDAPGTTSWELKTLFEQEVFERGILTLGAHNMSYAHTNEDVDRLLQVYDEVFAFLAKAVANGAVRQYLRCEPLVPLFRVR
jgi:glutamate-1-semialdehyde 2,1-aminomutase